MARVYVGHLDPRTGPRELEDAFYRYGRIYRIDVKNGYAFIEFDHPRDAEDAVYDMNGRYLDGERIVVEHARSNGPRGGFGGRGGGGGARGGCFSCGEPGHWARECPNGRSDACFNCRQSGHLARDCPEPRGVGGPPGGARRGRSRSRSPRRSRSRSPRRSRSRSPRRSRSPSPRRSRSPPPRRSRSPSPAARKSRSPSPRRSRSPSPRGD